MSQNAAHTFAARHAIAIYPHEAIYSFIPKNGCSNLRYAVARANGAVAGPEDFGWIQENNYTFSASLRDLATAKYTFVVLRCPYRRLVSAFADKLGSESWRMWRLFKAQPKLRAVDVAHTQLSRLSRGLALRLQPVDLGAFTFRDFVALFATEQARMSDHHWAPQHRFLVYKDYDDVFSLEDFRRCQTTVRERIGLEIEDTRAMSGHTTTELKRISGRPCMDTPIAELLAMKAQGTLPDFASFYDDALRQAVRRFYVEDVELYAATLGQDGLLFRD